MQDLLMPKFQLKIGGVAWPPQSNNEDWLEPTVENVRRAQAELRAAQGDIELSVRDEMTPESAKNAGAVLSKAWSQINRMVGSTSTTPRNPWMASSPTDRVVVDIGDAIESTGEGLPTCTVTLKVPQRTPDVVVAVLLLRLVNLVKWAKRYGRFCRLSTTTKLTRTTFDAITMRVEQGFDFACETPRTSSSNTEGTVVLINGDEDDDEDDGEAELLQLR